MKAEIEKKVKYYEGQLSRAIERFLEENSRKSRDQVVRLKERLRTYNECLNLIAKK